MKSAGRRRVRWTWCALLIPEELGQTSSAGVRTLRDQLVTLNKRVDRLDPLSTSRRQTKERFDVVQLIRQVIEGRASQFERHRIEVDCDLPKGHTVRAVKGWCCRFSRICSRTLCTG